MASRNKKADEQPQVEETEGNVAVIEQPQDDATPEVESPEVNESGDGESTESSSTDEQPVEGEQSDEPSTEPAKPNFAKLANNRLTGDEAKAFEEFSSRSGKSQGVTKLGSRVTSKQVARYVECLTAEMHATLFKPIESTKDEEQEVTVEKEVDGEMQSVTEKQIVAVPVLDDDGNVVTDEGAAATRALRIYAETGDMSQLSAEQYEALAKLVKACKQGLADSPARRFWPRKAAAVIVAINSSK